MTGTQAPTKVSDTAKPAATTRRRYDNTRRREGANATRARIVEAAIELVRESPIRDWRGVTIRTVASRAGVNERTVYRHFDNERTLRDAVMERLEREAGVDLSALRLDDVANVAARVLRLASSYPIEPRAPLDPTLAATNRRLHDALIDAVAEHTTDWPADDRVLAAAMLDLLWGLSSHDRLTGEWDLDSEDAIRAMTWVIELVETAIRAGQRPPRPRKGARP